MFQFTDFTGQAGIAFMLTTLLLPATRRLEKQQRAMLSVVVFVLALIPFGGLPISAYVRGATGDLSITTLVLLCTAWLNSGKDSSTFAPVWSKGRDTLLLLITLVALLFYPMALGAGLLDPYRIGYGEPLFIVVLLLLALVAWFKESLLVVLCIALSVLAWASGWYESNNLWDYMLDPFLAVYALWVVIVDNLKGLFRRPAKI